MIQGEKVEGKISNGIESVKTENRKSGDLCWMPKLKAGEEGKGRGDTCFI